MKIPGVEALTFDVGGTVFDWRGALETEVQWLSDEQGANIDARQFATDWRVRKFDTLDRMKAGDLTMLNADGIHRQVLDEVLEIHDSLNLSVVE